MKHDRILTLMMASVLSFTSIITSGGLHASAEEGTQNVQTSTAPEAQATGTTQVGSMLSERLNKEAAKMQDTEGCNIFSIESDGSAATVHFAASQDCRLVVGLYSDIYADGLEKMLGSVIRDVKAGEETAVISFGTDMPQYYVLRAYLIGDNDVPLCEVYAEENYTKDIMDLKASDIHSYADYEILNLDVNNLTPIEALNKLNDIKKILKG